MMMASSDRDSETKLSAGIFDANHGRECLGSPVQKAPCDLSCEVSLEDIKAEIISVRTESGEIGTDLRGNLQPENGASKIEFTPIADAGLSIMDCDRVTCVKASLATRRVHPSLAGALQIERTDGYQEVSINIFLKVCKLDLPVEGTFHIVAVPSTEPCAAVHEDEDSDDTSEALGIDLGSAMDQAELQTLAETKVLPADDLGRKTSSKLPFGNQTTALGTVFEENAVVKQEASASSQEASVCEVFLNTPIKDEADNSPCLTEEAQPSEGDNLGGPSYADNSIGLQGEEANHSIEGSQLGNGLMKTATVHISRIDMRGRKSVTIKEISNPATPVDGVNEDGVMYIRKRRLCSRNLKCGRSLQSRCNDVEETFCRSRIIRNAGEETFDRSKHIRIVPRTSSRPTRYCCRHCKKILARRECYYHLKTIHSITTPFPCEKCNFEAYTKANLLMHTKGKYYAKGTASEDVSEEKPFTCKECHKVFDFSCEFERHCITHPQGLHQTHVHKANVPEYLYRCKICGKIYVGIDTLEEHMQEQHVEQSTTEGKVETIPLSGKEYICPRCQYKVDSKAYLEHHINVQHDGIFRFLCEICGAPFAWFKSLEHHRESQHKVHEIDRDKSCNLCGRTFKFKYCLERHLKWHDRKNERTCNRCNYVAPKTATLKIHMRYVHLGEKRKFTCDHCPFSAGSRHTVQKHKRIHGIGLDKRYPCGQCGKQLHSARELSQHRRYHQGRNEKKQVCTVCGKFFKKSHLEKHTRCVHLGEKPDRKFPCSSCEYSARNPFNLKIHMRTHGVGRDQKYPCDTCGAQLSSALSLHRHKRQHEGASVQKHACTVCGKSFMQKCTLNRHMDVHSGVKRYKCDVCDVAFSQSFPLTKHLKKHHPEHFDHLVATGKYKGQRAMLGRTRD